MELRGDILIINNIDALNKVMFSHRIIFIGEPDPDLVRISNALVATLFIPPYEIIMHEMDGNVNKFVQDYYAYLNGKECLEYIALIIRSLYEGNSIALYLSIEESETMYSNVLLMFLQEQFGISVGVGQTTPAVFNQAYSYKICDLLYSMNLMNTEEFLLNYPSDVNITPIPVNISKLVAELNPYVPSRSFDDYLVYLNNLKQTIKQNNNRFMVSLIQLEV